jgi:hypothetical protein
LYCNNFRLSDVHVKSYCNGNVPGIGVKVEKPKLCSLFMCGKDFHVENKNCHLPVLVLSCRAFCLGPYENPLWQTVFLTLCKYRKFNSVFQIVVHFAIPQSIHSES